jgi:hypothetical protein
MSILLLAVHRNQHILRELFELNNPGEGNRCRVVKRYTG